MLQENVKRNIDKHVWIRFINFGEINHSHAYKRDVQGLKELQEHIPIIVLQLKLIL